MVSTASPFDGPMPGGPPGPPVELVHIDGADVVERNLRRFDGQVVLITAGADGIGAATARRFANEGASVVVADVDGVAAQVIVDELVSKGLKAAGITCDVSVAADAQAAVNYTESTYGRLDVLVNNAGIGPMGNVYSHTEDEWDRVFDVNVKGGFLMSKFAIPLMRKTGGGSILFTASVGGLRGTMRFLAYTASKAAIVQMVRSMALDHGRHGIRVNAICPGATRTPRWAANNPPMEASFAAATPVAQRIATPEEQAAVFAFLASKDASFISGQEITVDGGVSVGQMIPMLLEP
jgi:meso-butanediol dehydrogenase / (S,S)-butanediol dehydrogenase / diacetyl reductase